MARKDVEEYILKLMKEIDPKGYNVEIYKKYFKSLSNSDFKLWIDNLANDKVYLHMVIHTYYNQPTLEKLESIMKKMKINLYERITLEDSNGNKYMPLTKYKILTLPGRRASQHASKGISVHKNINTRNPLTGQVTGKESSTGAITLPESYILTELGLKHTMDELVVVRGGDVSASLAFRNNLEKSGKVKLKDLALHRQGVRSSKTVAAIFKGMHIDLNIGKNTNLAMKLIKRGF